MPSSPDHFYGLGGSGDLWGSAPHSASQTGKSRSGFYKIPDERRTDSSCHRESETVRHWLFCGSAAGVGLGVLLAWFKPLEDFFDLTLNFSRAIPKTALAPLLIVWFGFGDFPKILLIGLAAFFYTVIPTLEGVGNVDNLLVKSARSMGANNRQIVFGVLLPAAMPSIYAGLRIAATSSFVILLFVEIISGNSGLGFLLEDARESLNTSTMFMTLIVVGILGFSLDWLVRYTEKKVMPWQKGKTISR